MDKYYVHYIRMLNSNPSPIICIFHAILKIWLDYHHSVCQTKNATLIIQSRLRVCVFVQIQIVHVCMRVHACELHGML